MKQIKLGVLFLFCLAIEVNSRSISQEIEDVAHNIYEGVVWLEKYVQELNHRRHNVEELSRISGKIETEFRDAEDNLKSELTHIHDSSEKMIRKVSQLETELSEKNKDLEKSKVRLSGFEESVSKLKIEHNNIETSINLKNAMLTTARENAYAANTGKKTIGLVGGLFSGLLRDDDRAVDDAIDTGIDWLFDSIGRKKRDADYYEESAPGNDYGEEFATGIDLVTGFGTSSLEAFENQQKQKIEFLNKQLGQKKVQLRDVERELQNEKWIKRQTETHIKTVENQLRGLKNQLSRNRETLKELEKVVSKTNTAVNKITELHNHAESLYETTEIRAKTYKFFNTFHGAADDVIGTAKAMSVLVEAYPELGSSLLMDKARDIINKCNKIKQLLDEKKLTFDASNFS